MKFIPQHLYHVYNIGNNSQQIFYSEENYFFFLKKMKNHLTKHSRVLAYCLMPNHFHWLLLVRDVSGNKQKTHPLNQQIGTLISSYTQAINRRYRRRGPLFQQSTKAKILNTSNYAEICFHYIHQNPICAGLVDEMGRWPYSSFPDYYGKRNGSLVKKEAAFKLLDIQEKSFFEQSKQALDPEKIEKLY